MIAGSHEQPPELLVQGRRGQPENDYDPSDKTNTNYSLECADADKAHWLQFVNFTMWADTPIARVDVQELAAPCARRSVCHAPRRPSPDAGAAPG